MPDSRRVTNIEKKLGLKWERGVSLAKRESCKVRVIKRLVDDIDELKQKYVSVLPSQLRHMEQFNSDCYELYKKHAPRLWADPPADRSAWLVNASVNTWNGLYTRDLFVGKDDELLQDLFSTLAFEKCVRYHENQKQQARRTLKSYNESDPSEVTSPAIEYEDGVDSYAYLSPERAHVSTKTFAGSTSSLVQSYSRRYKSDHSADGPVAPVAQMIPGQPSLDNKMTQPSFGWPGGLDSDSEAFSDDDSDDEPVRKPAWKKPTPDTTQTPNAPGNNIDDPDYTPGSRKRNTSNALRAAPIAKRQRKGDPTADSQPVEQANLQHPKQSERPSAVIKLKLKHTPTQNPVLPANVSPPRSEETPDIGSTIQVSRMPPPGNRKGKQIETINNVVNTAQHDKQTAQDAPSSSINQQPTLTETTSQPSSRQKDKSSSGLRLREDKSIYDFPGSPIDLHRPFSHERDTSAGRQESSIRYADSPVAGHSAASSHEASQPTSSLYNECSNQSDTRPPSLDPVDVYNAQGAGQTQQSLAAPNDAVDEASVKTEVANAATMGTSTGPHHAYVESSTGSTDRSTPNASASLERLAPSHSPTRDPSAYPFKESDENIKADTSTCSDRGDQTEANTDDSKPEKATTCSQAESIENRTEKLDVYNTPTASSTAKMDEVHPAQSSLPQTTVAASENSTVNIAEQPYPSGSAETSRKLLLQLITTDVKLKQFIIIGFDCLIEDLFAKVEKRMKPRLDSKPIKHMALGLPSHPEEAYLIQRDDPETWEAFLEMAEEEVGQKIKVLADVEF